MTRTSSVIEMNRTLLSALRSAVYHHLLFFCWLLARSSRHQPHTTTPYKHTNAHARKVPVQSTAAHSRQRGVRTLLQAHIRMQIRRRTQSINSLATPLDPPRESHLPGDLPHNRQTYISSAQVVCILNLQGDSLRQVAPSSVCTRPNDVWPSEPSGGRSSQSPPASAATIAELQDV